jgi:hypothetical protein
MKKWIAFLLVVFAVGLGVVVGNRLSVDAMAVVVGVVCGVGASIPTSLLLVLVMGRRERKEEQRQAGYPPVVIVNPGAQGGYGPQGPYLPPPGPGWENAPRQFKVVGEEAEEDTTLYDLWLER